MINHLWQSTGFAVFAGLLALVFRRNQAQVRYWLWFSASMKFFVPLALLMSLGSRFEWSPKTAAAPDLSVAIEQVTEPFPETVTFAPAARGGRDWKPMAISALWASGFAAIALLRLRGWLRVRAALRASVPMHIPAGVEVRSSPGLLEPGVVGWIRPVLLVPEGIAECLTPRQLEAVLAHELCHVRRRDNLTSTIHMMVEAAFWFHPLVWWIGARLVEERERACDEGVLSLGNEPQIYAEAILKVCKLYVESPLACVPGVTGADLKKRIEAIMTNQLGVRLNFAKKIALATAGAAALAAPMVIGMMNTPHLSAQSPPPPVAPMVVDAPAKPPVVSQADPQIAAQQKAPKVEASPLDPKTYLIGAEDVLSIGVFHEPELTRVETVREDGKIRMPLVGDVQAAGLTPERLGGELKEALSVYIVNPDVTVTILRVNSKRKAPAPVMQNIALPAAAEVQATPALQAQTAVPKFEVASIRLCEGGDGGVKGGGGRGGGGGGGAQGPSPDRLTMNCQPLRNYIRSAYVTFADGRRMAPGNMTPIEGGPGWVDSERYQITAKAEGTPGQEMMRGPMLQALLEDRFKLKVRLETREVPAYALTVAKNGPKLQAFQEGSCRVLDFSKPPAPPAPGEKPMPFCTFRMLRAIKPDAPMTWEVHGGTLDDLARALGGDLDRIVVNRTGIAGKYDYRLEFSADDTTAGLNRLRGPDGPVVQPASPADPAGGPSIFTAIQEQLGLKLESGKGPREFLVVERAERPTEN